MYLLNVKYMYRILYLICLKKTESTLSKKEKKNKKQKEKKRKAFFSLPFAAKWPGVNAASVLDDYLLG